MAGQTLVALLAWQSEGAGILWEGDLGSLHFGEGFCDPSLFFFLTPQGNSLLSSLSRIQESRKRRFPKTPKPATWGGGAG